MTAAAVINVPKLCAQVLAEADYEQVDTALCHHFEINKADLTLPESAFSGKDEHGCNISMLMLMPHCVIKPHSLSHSWLEH